MANIDYTTIENLKKKILCKDVRDENGKISWEKHDALFAEYEREIGMQVKPDVYLAYEYAKSDIYVDVTGLLCMMKRIYPRLAQRWVLLKVGGFILEDAKIGSTKVPLLNHTILDASISKMGMTTYELLGLTLK